MKKNAPTRTVCVEGPAGAGGRVLPAPAVVVVVVVLLVTAGLSVLGTALEAVVPIVVTGGLLGRELVRGLVAVLSPQRA
ncbi:hypothetical protein [Streptomyces sp. SCL15-4]|uniref:hypothetical protein n=1 Tax=Streptomyces sp. SCL15-4 TaxID=2967221 RepID=UPI002966F6D9|nr:hypothetical protein [Streptomyces sp. SCL15-4]